MGWEGVGCRVRVYSFEYVTLTITESGRLGPD
jgi:hypothetical protein